MNLTDDNKQRELISNTEGATVARKLHAWLNTFESLPVDGILYGNLPAGGTAMAMTMTRTTYKAKQYITGGYLVRFHFALTYRIQPNESSDQRLAADEILNVIADQACNADNLPDLGERCQALRINIQTPPSEVAVWPNGDEDHTVLFVLMYEVM